MRVPHFVGELARDTSPVFASTYLYAMCKTLGIEAYKRWLAEHTETDAALRSAPCQGLRTLGHLALLCDFDLGVDAGTYITRSRSVMAGRFLASNKDVWITVDDDIEASAEVLGRLLLACRATRDVVAAPYLNRDGGTMTFRLLYGEIYHVEGIALRSVDRIGAGLMALHRDLVEALAEKAPRFRSSNKEPMSVPDCPALFLEGVEDGDWMGEDYWFSRLCEQAGRPIHCLLDAPITHASWTAKVGLDSCVYVVDPSDVQSLASKPEPEENS